MQRRPTTQDISWFLDLYKNGQLDLEPPYQRRSVWSPKDRRFFLDTIFRGYATPGEVMQSKCGMRNERLLGLMFKVVDGLGIPTGFNHSARQLRGAISDCGGIGREKAQKAQKI